MHPLRRRKRRRTGQIRRRGTPLAPPAPTDSSPPWPTSQTEPPSSPAPRRAHHHGRDKSRRSSLIEHSFHGINASRSKPESFAMCPERLVTCRQPAAPPWAWWRGIPRAGRGLRGSPRDASPDVRVDIAGAERDAMRGKSIGIPEARHEAWVSCIALTVPRPTSETRRPGIKHPHKWSLRSCEPFSRFPFWPLSLTTNRWTSSSTFSGSVMLGRGPAPRGPDRCPALAER